VVIIVRNPYDQDVPLPAGEVPSVTISKTLDRKVLCSLEIFIATKDFDDVPEDTDPCVKYEEHTHRKYKLPRSYESSGEHTNMVAKFLLAIVGPLKTKHFLPLVDTGLVG